MPQTPVGDDARIVPRTLRHRKVPGRDKSRPYDRRKARTQPGNGNLAVPQAPVGDDACIVPHPRGGANAPGGINPAPTNEFYASDQTGTAATTQAAVGRDALIPPDPAAAQTPAGGYGIRPYGRRRMPRPAGKRQPCRAANPCRGRCSHRPAPPRRRKRPRAG